MANKNHLSSMVQDPRGRSSFNRIDEPEGLSGFSSLRVTALENLGHSSASADEMVVTSDEPFFPPTGAPKRRYNKSNPQKSKKAKTKQPVFSKAQLDDSEFSDGEDVQYAAPRDTDTYMLKRPRSSTLLKLPNAVKEPLKQERSTLISHEYARRHLGLGERWQHVNDTNPEGENMLLSDSSGYLHLSWRRPPPTMDFLSGEKLSKLMTEAAGDIRDQGKHSMCCFYCLCDLISSSAVLHGQMQNYEALSQMFVCQKADPKEYAKLRQREHCFYECHFETAIKSAKEERSGIPLATEDEKRNGYGCKVERKVQPGEKTFRIKQVYKYETLDQALLRLKTHTVAATLLSYEGWVDKGLYAGPGEKNRMLGYHEVLMLACVIYEGKMAIKCKSSNGTRVGHDGYIYVDPEVMVIEVASSRKRDRPSSCRIRPTHLLFDFYSIDMENGQYAVKFLEEEFENQRESNSLFKVNFQGKYGRPGRSGMSYHQSEFGGHRLA